MRSRNQESAADGNWSTIAAWRVMSSVWEVLEGKEESEELFVTCTARALLLLFVTAA